MIVRLKEKGDDAMKLIPHKFQFYDSPIKSELMEYANELLDSFNSMIVRLKVNAIDSTMVNVGFQFYDSPIKRTRAVRSGKHYRRFQFYDSPIKSFFSDFVRLTPRGFNSMIVRLKESLI